MNFMSGRSGFCEDITASTPPNFNFRALPSAAGEVAASVPASAASPQPPESSPTNNGGDDSDDHMRGEEGGGSSRSAGVIEREHMFDKVVTPSDVGKLNRLVIPKQHAEKYFPLDSSANEKGLLLNFEDRNGKPWRFRYSYWNSSQSYVMTKGWSRFVKEKKLDAGDVVSFQRGVGESGKDRLFIDWRHRPDVPEIPPPLSIPGQFSFHRSSIHPWSPLFLPPPPPPPRDYSHLLQHHQHHHQHALTNYTPNYAYSYSTAVVNGNPCSPASIMYLRSAPAASSASFGAQLQLGIGQTSGSGVEQMVFNAVPVVQGKAAAKRLRLFGVNMDCPISESDGCDIVLSSTTHPQPTIPLHHSPDSGSYSLPCSSIIHRPNRGSHTDADKGKASRSLDLDI